MIQTKDTMRMAFESLCLTKDVDKISVKDVTDAVGMYRQSFYYHFKDLDDLVLYVFAYYANLALAHHHNLENWPSGLTALLETISQKKTLAKALFASSYRQSIETFLYRYAQTMIQEALVQSSLHTFLSKADFDLLVAYYKFALMGVCLSWVDHGMQGDPSHFVAKISLLVKDGFASGISRFVTKK